MLWVIIKNNYRHGIRVRNDTRMTRIAVLSSSVWERHEIIISLRNDLIVRSVNIFNVSVETNYSGDETKCARFNYENNLLFQWIYDIVTYIIYDASYESHFRKYLIE